MTIRKTLLVAFLSVGLLPAILLASLAFVKAREAVQAEIERNLAIQATGDGIVHPEAARAPSAPNVENVTVAGSHSGLGWNIAAIRLIADRLARN